MLDADLPRKLGYLSVRLPWPTRQLQGWIADGCAGLQALEWISLVSWADFVDSARDYEDVKAIMEACVERGVGIKLPDSYFEWERREAKRVARERAAAARAAAIAADEEGDNDEGEDEETAEDDGEVVEEEPPPEDAEDDDDDLYADPDPPTGHIVAQPLD